MENFFNVELSLIRIFLVMSILALLQMLIFVSFYKPDKFSHYNWLYYISASALGQS